MVLPGDRTPAGGDSARDPDDPAGRLLQHWQAGQNPDARQFLRDAGPLAVEHLVEVLRVDQCQRWQRGTAVVPAEEYLRWCPELGRDPERALELIFGEYVLREDMGQTPRPAEYLHRFPQYAARLEQQLQFHQALAGDGSFVFPDASDEAQVDSAVASETSDHLPALDVPLPAVAGYEVSGELGRGGMGVVYLARNTLMDRLEVLKVVNQARVGLAEAVERFLQEIRSAGRLNHPNVATAYSVHQVGDLLVLAMEYVEGDDLAKVVKEKGALPISNACFCAHQAALGLQRGHELELVHRDIKPSNLLLGKHGKRPVIKIVDFGLAKAKTEMPSDRGLTGTNQMMGTPGYTAPEQIRNAKNADTRADIYSLGCTLYYLLSGSPPFRGRNAIEVLLAQQSDKWRPLRELRPEVPEELAAVVAKMMAPDPARRFQKPAEVAAALVPFIKQKPSSPGSSGAVQRSGKSPSPGDDSRLAGVVTPADPRSGAAWSRRRLLTFIGAALLFATLGIGTAVVLRQKPRPGTAVVTSVPDKPPPRPGVERLTVAPSEAAKPTADGFVALFNGRDLTDWKPHPIGKAEWSVTDGVLTGRGNTGHLFYTGTVFENFHLKVEATINDGGNSGVYVRAPFGPSTPNGFPTGAYEAKINDTHKDSRKTGSLFVGNQAAVTFAASPVKFGEWFTMEVIADGPGIVVKVNGHVTANYVDAGPNSRTGMVALQVHTAETVVRFRSVLIKELPPGDLRLQWVHSKGAFEQVKGNVWVERNGDARYFYREVERTSEYVRLRRKETGKSNRDVLVDIHRSNVEVNFGGTHWNIHFKDGAWKVLSRAWPTEKSPAARVGEWVPLLNGRDLTGLKPGGNDQVTWAYEAGELVGRSSGGTTGLLVTHRDDYDNFHLRLETMLSETTGGQVCLRCGPPERGPGAYRCYSVRIGGSADATVALAITACSAAGISLLPSVAVPLKNGAWIPVEVIAKGNHLQVLVAGNAVADYTDDNDTFRTGRIGFACPTNAVVRLRNIEIDELASATAAR